MSTARRDRSGSPARSVPWCAPIVPGRAAGRDAWESAAIRLWAIIASASLFLTGFWGHRQAATPQRYTHSNPPFAPLRRVRRLGFRTS